MITLPWSRVSRRARAQREAAALARREEFERYQAQWMAVRWGSWEKQAYWFYGSDMDDPEVTVR